MAGGLFVILGWDCGWVGASFEVMLMRLYV